MPGRVVIVAMCQLPLLSGIMLWLFAMRGVLSFACPSESRKAFVSGSLASLTTERSSPCAGWLASGRNMCTCHIPFSVTCSDG